MAPLIRRATPGDASGLTACISAAYAPYLHQGLDLPPVAEGIADDIRDHQVWVACESGTVLGGVVLGLGDGAHLINLAVDPGAAGRGLGKALVTVACDAARAAGAKTIALATHRDMTATQGFYRRLGWQQTGQSGDKVYFQRNL